jgi:hypothetical protein
MSKEIVNDGVTGIEGEATKIEAELQGIGLDLSHGTLQYLDLEEVDADHKWNVRDEGLYTSRVATKVVELENDKMIRTPLVAVRLRTMKPTDRPILSAGFLRHGALSWIRENKKELWTTYFAGRIPFIVIENVTEEQRTRLVLDHGSEVPLTEVEVAKQQWRLMRVYPKNRRTICSILQRCYYQLMDTHERTKFDLAIAEFRRLGYYQGPRAEKRFTTLAEVIEAKCKGRYQKLERIFEAPTCVKEEWLKYKNGDASAVSHLSGKNLETLVKMTPQDAELRLAQMRGEGAKKRDERAMVWGPARMVSAKSVCASRYYMCQLDAALGDQTAAQQLPEYEEQLVKVEQAIDKNPEFFWATVNEILETV